jgi:hypothetical protein
MTPAEAVARYILVPHARRVTPAGPGRPVRRLRLERINPRGLPRREAGGYPHLKRVYD